jgi:hypothetical protein
MDEYLNQTALGRLFDVSSHVIGRWLEQVQLRGPDQRPTPTAIQGGFTKTVPTSRHEGIAYFVWHAEKTIPSAPDRPADHSTLKHETG